LLAFWSDAVRLGSNRILFLLQLPSNSNHRVDIRPFEQKIDFCFRTSKDSGLYSILQATGGGVGLGDLDGDGFLDLICPGGGSLRPTGEIDPQSSGIFLCHPSQNSIDFTNSSTESGIAAENGLFSVVSLTDDNSDGFLDITFAGFGSLVHFRSFGDGTFFKVDLNIQSNTLQWPSAAAWGDMNADGNPDLFLAQYVNWSIENNPQCFSTDGRHREVCGPLTFQGLPDFLFESNGDGSLKNVSTLAGLRTDGKGLGCLLADLDDDCDLDLYVANDGTVNFLYRNEQGFPLVESAMISGCGVSSAGKAEGSMGIDLGDFNGDGRFDLFVTNFEFESMALYFGLNGGLFEHSSSEVGVSSVQETAVGWGTGFVDLEHDGDEDIVVMTGHTNMHSQFSKLEQLPLLLENVDGQRVKDVAPVTEPYFSTPNVARGLALGDVDLDGDIDFAVNQSDRDFVLLRNDSQLKGRSLTLRLIGTVSSRIPIGTKATLQIGTKTLVRQLKAGGSYASASDSSIHFGIPAGENAPPRLIIRWPTGKQNQIDLLGDDSWLTIIESATEDGQPVVFRRVQ
jgi:enediyne biosynthesis protein E4